MFKLTKKTVAFLLLLSVLLSTTACGSASQTTGLVVDQSVAGASATQTPLKAEGEGSVVTEKTVGERNIVIIEEESTPLSAMPAMAKCLIPEASGVTTYQNGDVIMDASNIAKGYVMVQYSGANQKIKIQISKPGGTAYTYTINARGGYEIFPLTDGNGSYNVTVFENVSGTQYAQIFGQVIDVSLENQFLPFLYPNKYVAFNDQSAAVKKGAELAGADDKTTVANVYNYVINNVSYDEAKAQTVTSGYVPNVDNVLASKKGICYDYAALMTAMLRSQNIPTKMVFGYAGSAYHAWINVYLDEVGWVDNAIYFDGKDWKLMDPTFASSGKNSDAVKKYIGDGANYQSKYTY